MRYALGIDLGTTFTSAAVSTESGTRMVLLSSSVVVPSMVYQAPDGTLLTGAAAEHAATDSGRVGRGFKRRIGDPTPLLLGGSAYSPTALMAAQLRDVLDQVTRSMGGAPTSVALTCPAVWGPYRREQFGEVPKLAGLEDVRLITEPEAAATHYSRERTLGEGEVVAVYDLGGGTLDTTVLRMRPDGMEILGTPEGVEHMGGIDFDDALLSHLDGRLDGEISELDPADPLSAQALVAIRELCVRTKIELSTEPDVAVTVPMPSGPRHLAVTRREFNTMIRPSVELTVSTLRRTVASAGLSVEDLSAVLLAGGSSRIPLVTQMVSEKFARPMRVAQHPKFTVALGAAVAATRAPANSDATPESKLAKAIASKPVKRKRRRLPGGVAAALVAVLVLVTVIVLIVRYPTMQSMDSPSTGQPSDLGAAPPGGTSAPLVEPRPVFGTDLVPPYRAFMHTGKIGDRSKEIFQRPAEQAGLKARIDNGLHVTWQGDAPAQVYLQSVNQFIDFSAYASARGALVFDVETVTPPDGPTALSAQCGIACEGRVETTSLLRDLRAGEQRTVVVPVLCLTQNGLDPRKVTVPFLLNSNGSFEATFRNIRWEANAVKDGTQCPSR